MQPGAGLPGSAAAHVTAWRQASVARCATLRPADGVLGVQSGGRRCQHYVGESACMKQKYAGACNMDLLEPPDGLVLHTYLDGITP